MLKPPTYVISKQSFQAEITRNAKEDSITSSLAACFTNTALRTDALLERVHVSYWRRMPVVLRVVHGATEAEYRIAWRASWCMVMNNKKQCGTTGHRKELTGRNVVVY